MKWMMLATLLLLSGCSAQPVARLADFTVRSQMAVAAFAVDHGLAPLAVASAESGAGGYGYTQAWPNGFGFDLYGSDGGLQGSGTFWPNGRGFDLYGPDGERQGSGTFWPNGLGFDLYGPDGERQGSGTFWPNGRGFDLSMHRAGR